MSPIEICLDLILTNLRENWDNFNQRKPLACEDLLSKMGFSDKYRKHEFFEGLIDKLVQDKHAEFIDENQRKEKNKIDFYQQNAIITVGGYFFINNGGYSEQRINHLSERIRVKSVANQTLILTWILALGTAPLGLLALADLYWKYHWFQNGWIWLYVIVGLVVFVLILNATMNWWLQKKGKKTKEQQ